MNTRFHVHEIELAATADEVFSLLLTPSAIREWWGAARTVVIPREGGTWAAAWGADEDAPDYVTSALLKVFQPPHRLMFGDYQYHSRSGPLPFDADFTTEFTIEPIEHGVRLRVRQDGFPNDPIADDFYHACEQGWARTFDGIRQYVANRGA